MTLKSIFTTLKPQPQEKPPAGAAEYSAQWTQARLAYPLYAALATQFKFAALPHPAGELPPIRPTREVFDADLNFLASVDEKVRAFQIRQLPPATLNASEESLRAIGELARGVGARVLVDEVYLECLHHPPATRSFHLGDNFVVTSSLTKAYGLSGLRCGWILAEPTLAERMWRLNDLFSATPVHIAELLSVMAIEQIEKLARRGDALIEANRMAMVEALSGHPAIECFNPGVGTTIFPRLRQGDVAAFCEFLRDEYETSVVPGSYFERPRHFRVGLTADVEMTREGLGRLARALSVWQEKTRD